MSIFFVAVSAMAQGKSISGVVRDAADHEPLVGASVMVKGASGQGALTDINGKFTVKNVKAGATLVLPTLATRSKRSS